MQRKYPDNAK